MAKTILPSRLSPTKTIDKMRTSMLRTTGTAAAALRSSVRATQTRRAHAISNPTLANIEKRWEAMPPQEQADLWMALRDRMKVDWTEMTLQEKKAVMSDESFKLVMPVSDRDVFNWVSKTSSDTSFRAAYWIAFGPHGPRAQTPPGEGKQVFWYTMGGLGVTAVLFFGIRAGARGSPPTMTKEYQEASDAYLKENNVEPITGISAEDYKGGFMVQSKPAQK
ncbi:hypothetical protein D6C99_04615 [Aureobasidium pullulans]|uniref:Cytochrome c oxidase polypeptide 5, mitochondrial n=2 Tax=Aureobasidium pullulans TaxID=5580 RepID=A0A4S9B2J3_AURPU|nr:hypothetical protein D6D28_01135 [Aureobasidium pullulans]THW67101.1 hypothetical protein D6D20_00760 [Aureobasidium pullulans]THW86744.1 hypothetical protein D6D15_07167 [Aureobasidium pullulans]THY50995.1 hypothetical protein D6C99_04615 [Aureobasidium pullulans]